MFFEKFEYFAFKKATKILIPIKSTESSTNRYKNSLKVLKNTCIVFPKKFLEQCNINLLIYQDIFIY